MIGGQWRTLKFLAYMKQMKIDEVILFDAHFNYKFLSSLEERELYLLQCNIMYFVIWQKLYYNLSDRNILKPV